MRMRILGGIAAVLLVIAAVALAHWRYGSLAGAVAYLGGHVVQVDNAIRDLGTVKPDQEIEVAFNLVNLQREPLKLVGANANCSCILPPQMPMMLQPLTPTTLTFNFTCPASEARFEQEIELYFDGPIPAMLLKISGVTR